MEPQSLGDFYVETFSSFWKGGTADTPLADAVLKVVWKGEFVDFHIHKLLLAVHSAKWRNVFFDGNVVPSEELDTSVEIVIANYPPRIIKCLLQHLYTETCEIPAWEDVGGLIKAAKEYQLQRLESFISSSLVAKLETNQALRIFQNLSKDEEHSTSTADYALDFLKEVMKIIFGFICRNADVALKMSDFMTLSLDNLTAFIESDFFHVERELRVFEGVDRWAKHNCKLQGLDADKYFNRRKVLRSKNEDEKSLGALGFIRFPVMDKEGDFELLKTRKKGYLPQHVIEMISRSSSDSPTAEAGTGSCFFSKKKRLSPDEHTEEFEKQVDSIIDRLLQRETQQMSADASSTSKVGLKTCDGSNNLDAVVENESLNLRPGTSEVNNNYKPENEKQRSVGLESPFIEAAVINDHKTPKPAAVCPPHFRNSSQKSCIRSQRTPTPVCTPTRLTRKVKRSSASVSSQTESCANRSAPVSQASHPLSPSPAKITRFVYELDPNQLDIESNEDSPKEKISIKNEKLSFAKFINNECKGNTMLKTIKLHNVEITELIGKVSQQKFPDVQLPHLQKFELQTKCQGGKWDELLKKLKSISLEDYVFFFHEMESRDARLLDLWNQNVAISIDLYGAKICSSSPSIGELTLNYLKPQTPFLLNTVVLENLISLSLGNCVFNCKLWLQDHRSAQLRELHLFCVAGLNVDKVVEKCQFLEKLIIWPPASDVSSRATVLSLKHLPKHLKYFSARNCTIKYVLTPGSESQKPFSFLEEMNLQNCSWDEPFMDELRQLLPRLREVLICDAYGTYHPKVLSSLLKMKSVKKISMLQFKMELVKSQDLKNNLKDWGVKSVCGEAHFQLKREGGDWELRNYKPEKFPRLLFQKFDLEKFYDYDLWEHIYREHFNI